MKLTCLKKPIKIIRKFTFFLADLALCMVSILVTLFIAFWRVALVGKESLSMSRGIVACLLQEHVNDLERILVMGQMSERVSALPEEPRGGQFMEMRRRSSRASKKCQVVGESLAGEVIEPQLDRRYELVPHPMARTMLS